MIPCLFKAFLSLGQVQKKNSSDILSVTNLRNRQSENDLGYMIFFEINVPLQKLLFRIALENRKPN